MKDAQKLLEGLMGEMGGMGNMGQVNSGGAENPFLSACNAMFKDFEKDSK